MKPHLFTILVENRPGVLMRVASLFTRRRFNIESISVGATENPDIARMTILTQGDDKTLEQIEKQLNKQVNVIKVKDISIESSVSRELCMLKLNASTEKEKSQIIQYTDVFRGRVVDVSSDTIGVEITGDSNKIRAFIDLVKTFGIKMMARTGVAAMERG